MKSVRLDQEQELRLREAAQQYGLSQSEFIRRAIDKACDEALGQPSLYELVKDIIDPPGQEEVPPEEQTDYARRAEELWGEHVVRKHAPYLDTARRLLERDQKPKTA